MTRPEEPASFHHYKAGVGGRAGENNHAADRPLLQGRPEIRFPAVPARRWVINFQTADDPPRNSPLRFGPGRGASCHCRPCPPPNQTSCSFGANVIAPIVNHICTGKMSNLTADPSFLARVLSIGHLPHSIYFGAFAAAAWWARGCGLSGITAEFPFAHCLGPSWLPALVALATARCRRAI